jgi:hypothetical protein
MQTSFHSSPTSGSGYALICLFDASVQVLLGIQACEACSATARPNHRRGRRVLLFTQYHEAVVAAKDVLHKPLPHRRQTVWAPSPIVSAPEPLEGEEVEIRVIAERVSEAGKEIHVCAGRCSDVF